MEMYFLIQYMYSKMFLLLKDISRVSIVQVFLSKYMEVDNILKSNITFVIMFMTSVMKDYGRRIPMKVLFHFSLSIIKVRYVSLYAISIVEFVHNRNTICIDITNDVGITNEELHSNITKEKPILKLLCDTIMNASRLLEFFLFIEEAIPISMKVKYFLYV